MKHSKRYNNNYKTIDRNKEYSLEDATKLLTTINTANFDESIELSVNLGVDPKHADQIVRGTVSLPHGTGKEVKVLVFAKDHFAEEAVKAGADFVGSDEFIDKVRGGWTDIDIIIATPDMMADVGKLGKILGPRGLMPNPKTGTVTNDVKSTIENINKGLVAYKNDKAGTIHAALGKVSFDESKLTENVISFIDEIKKIKPSGLKGNFVNSVYLSSSMGFGLRVEI